MSVGMVRAIARERRAGAALREVAATAVRAAKEAKRCILIYRSYLSDRG
jgi:hypothetical protein